MLKPTLSLEKQLELLKSRGLLIPDEEFAAHYLSENSYYHLNIYFKCFQKKTDYVDELGNDIYEFFDNTTFKHVVQVHENDKQIRSVLLKAIMPIELKIRTAIAYYVGLARGSDCFYLDDPKTYPAIEKIKALRSRFENSLDNNNPIVRHHTSKYNFKFPLFAIFELMSFSFLIDYFELLSFSVQDKIANKYFGLPSSGTMINWMKCINDLRNICAHQNFLYTRLFNREPKFFDTKLLYSNYRKTLYAYCIVIGYLSNKRDWLTFITELDDLNNKRKLLNLKSYGFDPDWSSRLETVPQLFRPFYPR